MTQVLVELKTENFHEVSNILCDVNGKVYTSYFYYKNDIPVEPREDIDRFFPNMAVGSIDVEGVPTKGILCYTNDEIPTDQINQALIKKFTPDTSNCTISKLNNTFLLDRANLSRVQLAMYKKNLKKQGHDLNGAVFLPSPNSLEKKHVISTVITIDGKFYSAYLFYDRDVKSENPFISSEPIHTSLRNLTFDKIGRCLLNRSGFEKIGMICLVDSNSEMLEAPEGTAVSEIYNLTSFEVKKEKPIESYPSEEKIAEILKFVSTDYPDHPLPKFRSKSEKITSSGMIAPDIPSEWVEASGREHFKPARILLESLQSLVESGEDKTSESIRTVVTFWKKYSFERMDRLMELARTTPFDKDSISSCPYLSIEILKKWNNFKFNWKLVTQNDAISIRDILANPDMQWNSEILYNERILPRGFYKYRGIKVPKEYESKDMDEPFVYSEIELIYSPEEPRDYSVYLSKSSSKKESDEEFPDLDEETEISDSDINDAIGLIMGEFPEYFENSTDTFITNVRNKVIEMIENNGVFILDDFVFPEDEEVKDSYNFHTYDDEDEKEPVPPEPTDEDPHSLRDLIEKIRSTKRVDTYSPDMKKYLSVTNMPRDCKFFVKNRNEYVAVLASLDKYEHMIEKSIFFEFEDAINYPKAFIHGNKERTICNSGKLTPEFIMAHQNYDWRVSDIIEALPIDYILENLLFYPDRLVKFPFLYANQFSENLTSNEIHNELLKQDVEFMSIFTRRVKETDYELLAQYPNLKWNHSSFYSFNQPKQVKDFIADLKKKSKKETASEQKSEKLTSDSVLERIRGPTFDDESSGDEEQRISRRDRHEDNTKYVPFVSWDYFKTRAGVSILVDVVGKPFDFDLFDTKSDFEKDTMLINFIKTNKDILTLLADVIPDTLITKNPKTKWYAPNTVNIKVTFDAFLKENSSEFLFALVMFLNVQVESYRYDDLTSVFYSLIESMYCSYFTSIYDTVEDKVKLYESYISTVYFLTVSIEKIFKTSCRGLLGSNSPYIKVANLFTLEDMGKSKYKMFNYAYEDITGSKVF